MRAIHIMVEDSEYKKLAEKKKKSGLNWHDFILKLIKLNGGI